MWPSTLTVAKAVDTHISWTLPLSEQGQHLRWDEMGLLVQMISGGVISGDRLWGKTEGKASRKCGLNWGLASFQCREEVLGHHKYQPCLETMGSAFGTLYPSITGWDENQEVVARTLLFGQEQILPRQEHFCLDKSKSLEKGADSSSCQPAPIAGRWIHLLRKTREEPWRHPQHHHFQPQHLHILYSARRAIFLCFKHHPAHPQFQSTPDWVRV